MKFPVTFQIVVQVADGAIWLYEKKGELQVPPCLGLKLVGHVPNVTGPAAGYDNVVAAIVDDARAGDVRVAVHGFRDPTRTAEEIDLSLPGWSRQPDPLQRSPLSPGSDDDQISSLFNN